MFDIHHFQDDVSQELLSHLTQMAVTDQDETPWLSTGVMDGFTVFIKPSTF
jgi:hypothetical protein